MSKKTEKSVGAEYVSLEDKYLLRKKERNSKILVRVGAGIAIVGLCAGSYFAGGNIAGKRLQEQFDAVESQRSSVDSLDRTVSGKSAQQDREDAVRAMQFVLQELYKARNGEDLETRLNRLDKGDESGVPKSVKDKVRFVDYLEKNEGVQRNTYQALITFQESTFSSVKDEDFSPDEGNMGAVFVDPEIGRAFIPLNIFNRTPGAVSVEMVYYHGEWRIDPYSFMEAIHLTAQYQSTLKGMGGAAPQN